ncbi:MAG TPA: palindromic element RPE5 domain-containing protein [Rickettsia endosymbiont of Pyrocoelia pectoralis]|nr:palindromic element RPE5 domain-containing protein [Rickettsia endosymbiont of Pyrocoelia pectoralis]
MEKSKEAVSRGAERTIVREHSRSYKDDVANFEGFSEYLAFLESLVYYGYNENRKYSTDA